MAILFAVAWQFYRDLHHEGWQNLVVQWQWLALSALLYVVGLGFSAWFYYRVLTMLGARPRLLAVVRAYYLSQLGKYVPGKALALIMRGAMIRGPEVKLGVALVATFYEVLTTMASGAILAAALFALRPPRLLSGDWDPVLLGLLLAALCGVPLLPGVFNFVIGRLARRFQNIESFKLPRLRAVHLLEGLVTTSAVWICFGFSLWAMIQGLLPAVQPLTLDLWALYTAIIALACVGGFVAVVVPGGLGVREWVLDRLLGPELAATAVVAAQPVAVVIVLLLRVVWTASELVMAALVWKLPRPRSNSA